MSHKFLFISKDALISDIAWQVIKEGHDAKYFIEDKNEDDIADGFVPKTKDWKKELDWAEVIVFDDVLGQGTLADKLRKNGKKVIGGTPYTDRLEDDRSFGQRELKKHGVKIIPFWEFSNFDEAIQFVREHPDEYVIKPSGEAQNIKRLLFVGMEKDGSDVIRVLESYKRVWFKEIKIFQLQKKVNGVEIAVGAFFNGRNFIYPININFEHKKLFPGNFGPATGEMGCYDQQTEVLTNNGWKFFKDLTYKDEICTLNPLGDVIEFHRPSRIVSFNHHKKLVSIQNQTLDIKVTLDHNMYVSTQWQARNKRNQFIFVKAKDLQYQSLIKRTGKWIGKEEKYFFLPFVAKRRYEGKRVVFRETGEIKIPMDRWVSFLGIWLADGCASTGKISIAQKDIKKTNRIENLLTQLPFKFSKRGSEFYIYNKQLFSYLESFGKAYQKYTPEFIKKLSPRQIRLFLDWLILGDGTEMKNGFRIFYTSSKKLADDVQELLLKINRVGIIKQRKRYGKRWIQDHFAHSSRVQYEVLERVKKLNSWIDKRDMTITNYNGKVYCATVKNHVMYVRRNGKPYWCGNTSMFWSQPNNLFHSTLEKLKDTLQRENYAGYIDLNCIVNGQGIYPLEFSCRFGYPTISIQQEGMITPIGEFLYHLANGHDVELKVKKGFQVGIRIVVPPYPFRDKKTFDSYSKNAVIVFKNNGNINGIHIEDVKLVNNQWVITGSAGVALIVVGTGLIMKEAQAQAYSRIKNILIPNMYYRDDIGDRWFDESDKLYSWDII